MDLFDIGDEIRSARKAKKMTQADLSEASGVSRVWISQIESGSVYDVKFGTILKLMTAVGLTIKVAPDNGGMPVYEELLEEDGHEAPGMG